MLSTDLDWFVELARTRHMGDTAAKLGIPQPTLSRRLSRLEEALGTRLFDRGGRHLELNARGRVYADAAITATESLRAGAAGVARLIDPRRGPARLDFMHSLGTWMVPEILRTARATRPDAPITLHQGPALELVDRVLSDDADLALVGPQPEQSLAGGPLTWTPWPVSAWPSVFRPIIASPIPRPRCGCGPSRATRSSPCDRVTARVCFSTP